MSQSMPQASPENRAIFAWATIAVLLRLGVALAAWTVNGSGDCFAEPDTESYLRPAEQLLSDGRFAVGNQVELERTPGYPLLLAVGLSAGSVMPITIVLQAILAGFTVWLVAGIARLLFDNRKITLAAAALYTFEPLSILYAVKLSSETLFTAIATCGVYLAIRSIDPPKLSSAIGSAILLAAATYVRPIGYWLPCVIAPLVGFGIWRRTSPRSAIAFCAGMLLASYVLIGLWQVRNWTQASYGDFSAITAVNAYYYQAAAVLAREEGRPFYEVQEELGYHDRERYLAQHPEQRNWSAAQSYAYLKNRGWQVVRHHPLSFALIHAQGVLRTVADPGGIEFLKLFSLYPKSGGLLGRAVDGGPLTALAALARERPLAFGATIILGIALSAYWLAAITGLFVPAARPTGVVIIVCCAAYFLVASGGAQALARFRHPVMPYVCVLAGAGSVALVQRIRRYGVHVEASSDVPSRN